MEEHHQHQLRYLEQLSNAHKSSILLYFREEKSVDIVRKIRPEVHKISKTGEIKDVMRMVEKYNYHPNIQGINLIIAEVDHTTQKLLEFLRRRHVEEATRSFPLLPLILLVPEECEPDTAAAINQAQNVDVILHHPYDAKEVFDAVINVLTRIQSVQSVYSDIHKFKESRKYTHLPLFDDDARESDGTGGITTTGSMHLPKVAEELSDDDGDEDDSECASEVEVESVDHDVVPDFLVSMRSEKYFSKTRTFDKVTDPKERAALDSQIVKALRSSSGASQTISLMQRRDSFTTRGSLMARPSQVDRSGSALVDMSHKKLLEDTTRPVWRVNHSGAENRRRPSTVGGPSSAYNPALMPFINRPTPVLRPRSVAGLNKKDSANCWKTLRNKSTNGNGASGSTTGSSARGHSSPAKSTTKANARGDSSAMAQEKKKDNKPKGVDRSGSTEKLTIGDSQLSPIRGKSPPPPLSLHASFSMEKRSPHGCDGREDTGPLTAPAHEAPHGRHFFTASSELDGSSIGEDSNEPMGYIAHQAMVKKQLLSIIAKAPNDPDTKSIIPINLSDRVLGFDIRDQLEMGYRYEQEGDYANAEVCYTRAVSASKRLSRSLPLLMRGVVFFHQKKYFLAIRDFTEAIPFSPDEAGETAQEKSDIAIALHNRALAHFCVGNDTNGVEDLNIALDNYQPENLKIREMLLLAYKRLGKFNLATSECIKLQNYVAQEQMSISSSKRQRQTVVNNTASVDSAQRAIAMFNQDRRKFGSALAPRVPAADRDSIKARTSMAAKVGANLSLISNSRQANRKGTVGGHHDRSGLLTAFDSTFGNGPVPIRTISVPVAAPNFSIKKKKNRIADGTTNYSNPEDSLNETNPRLSLDQAKADLGFTRDIFESIFIRTSPLQDILSIQPNMRSVAQLNVISRILRQVPFLHKLADADLRDLSACVEYRVITTKGPLFSQDKPLDVFCVLLTGQWQMRLDILDNVVQLGNLDPMDIYGHLDLLFQEKYKSPLVAKYLDAAESNRLQAIEEGIIQSDDEDSIGHDGNLPRALAPNTFMSCYVMKPTEVLLISAEDFAHRLFPIAEKDFETRMELLTASGLFDDDLSILDLVRMVRMCRVESVRPGAVIVKQGEAPSKLYFVLNGICKVQKRPDKAERTRARLMEMKEQTDEHDMKYSFHHKLRGQLTPAPPEFEKVASHNFATAAEAHRHKLGMEIDKLEQSHILREKSNTESDVVDVTTLKWPRVFGEASVAVPEGRSSLGTVVADTYCEILWVHKAHLQTFKLGEKFQERLRLRAVRYPSDHILVEKLQTSKEWTEYRSGVLGEVNKSKWPGHIKPSSQAMRY